MVKNAHDATIFHHPDGKTITNLNRSDDEHERCSVDVSFFVVEHSALFWAGAEKVVFSGYVHVYVPEHAHVKRRDLYVKTRTYALSMLAITHSKTQ